MYENDAACAYLQVNRAVLDFDFEKTCCVSLANINVYGCLVCGKYYQGRGRASPAYVHSLESNHRVFINLLSGLVYWSVRRIFERRFVTFCDVL